MTANRSLMCFILDRTSLENVKKVCKEILTIFPKQILKGFNLSLHSLSNLVSLLLVFEISDRKRAEEYANTLNKIVYGTLPVDSVSGFNLDFMPKEQAEKYVRELILKTDLVGWGAVDSEIDTWFELARARLKEAERIRLEKGIKTGFERGE